MKISPRRIWTASLCILLAGCSSLQNSSRFTQFRAPSAALTAASERLREETREFLKEEDRWFPKGRDVSLWNSAQMVSVAGRNLQNGLTDANLTPQELRDLLANTRRQFKDFEYWTANVKVNESILRAMNEVRSPLEVIARDAGTLSSNQTRKAAVKKRSSDNGLAAIDGPSFSPNDLNRAVSIGKAYLLEKYGIRSESIGNMRCQEKENHHEVVLETRQTGYLLRVDVRQAKVLKEKTYPKLPRVAVRAS